MPDRATLEAARPKCSNRADAPDTICGQPLHIRQITDQATGKVTGSVQTCPKHGAVEILR